ncbi:MAG: HD domain-containing protein [Desulfuromonadales bacterium]|nr:HD domain-containing protein [Desulfuromonadales bacterium]
MAYITVISPFGRKKVELQEQNSIGRESGNRIQLQDRLVSKSHCTITLDENHMCFIEDRSSRNGTYVNNRLITVKTPLYTGDEIRIGNTLLLFEDNEHEAAQMVEIEDVDEGSYSSIMAPQSEMQFLSEDDIFSEKALRADYEKLRVTYELQNEMSLDRDIDKTLNRILARTFEFLEYDHGVILLAGKGGGMVPLSYKSRRKSEKLRLSSTLIRYVQENKTGVISTDMSSDQRFNSSESILLEGVKSTIAVPIMAETEILGMMILNSTEMTNAFTVKDLGLISTIANQAARIIKNSLLHEELRLMFDSSIRTLSATVDARHPLTAGHSERVNEISILIAQKLGLSENEIRVLKFATLMHDIGKIAVPDKILLKSGKFSPEERDVMDTHSIKTREILENFYFPLHLEQVPLIASSHHEKMDGTGYPQGLKGTEIPMVSRIIAVADMFDALTAKRDYPKYIDNTTLSFEPLPLSTAVSIITNGAGVWFDKDVVDAFIASLQEISDYIEGVRKKISGST